MVADHYLTVKQWHPNFDPSEAMIDKIAVWVRLPDLAMNMETRRMPAFISSNTTSLKIKDAYQAACDLELDEMAAQNQSL
ncbi:hypothetical protein NC653_028781 [Populus alba x Populus x berolinensis]|uniref:DUF4283 domain-containing protein n=1 Tax=Populus alba x Populus x berolinensis TaxID=444605 RepID=A0AAD6M0Y6_9ROSI|nr:hypothetical protein NC653_028781 [Populus alba x Populus x berolinensis]